MEPIVTLLFRKRNPRYFSIEKVFANLVSLISVEFPIVFWNAPSSRAKPVDILKNGLAARKLKSTIYHITGDVHYLAFFLPKKKTVLTIHDCIFLKEKNPVKRRILKWLFLDGPVRNVQFITTISEATKKDILEHTNCQPEKVIVIPNATDPAFYPSRKTFNPDNPVILQVGTSANKNIERVAAALEGIRCTLDIVGMLSEQQLEALKRHRINYTNSFNLRKEELVEKYRSSDMVVFATTFEGFGLPVLEAQQCGKPLVTSNISPVAEVAGEGALLVDPYDVHSIRSAITTIINEETTREALIQKGFSNIKRFSPEETASLYSALYREIIKQS